MRISYNALAKDLMRKIRSAMRKKFAWGVAAPALTAVAIVGGADLTLELGHPLSLPMVINGCIVAFLFMATAITVLFSSDWQNQNFF